MRGLDNLPGVYVLAATHHSSSSAGQPLSPLVLFGQNYGRPINILRLVVRGPVQQRLVQIGILVAGRGGETNPQRHPDLVVGVLNGYARGNGGRHEGPGGLGDVRIGGRTSVEAVSEGPGISGGGGSTGSEGQGHSHGGVAHDDGGDEVVENVGFQANRSRGKE